MSRSEARMGRLYGVGVGPGDPELLTLKACRILESAHVICLPKGRDDREALVMDIIAPYIDRSRQEVLEVVFPMTKDREALEAHWAAALRLIRAHLEEGRDVAFVTLGDPLFFSTWIHLHAAVQGAGLPVEVEVVPGLSSVSAAAARLGLPLAVGEEAVAVLSAQEALPRLEGLLEEFETVVLMKVNRGFSTIVERLRDLGLVEKARLAVQVGTEHERLYADITAVDPAEVPYMSLIIVRGGR